MDQVDSILTRTLASAPAGDTGLVHLQDDERLIAWSFATECPNGPEPVRASCW